MKRLAIIALLLLVGGSAVGWYWLHRPQPPSDVLVLHGNVDVREVNLAFKVNGRIEAMQVDEGDPVEAGQVVASLDAGYYEDEMRQAGAALEMRRADLDKLQHGSRPEEIAQARALAEERRVAMQNAQVQYERIDKLYDRGSSTKSEYDNARTTLDEAKAQLNSAEAALKLAELGPRQEDVAAGEAQLHNAEAVLAEAERRVSDAKLSAPSRGIVQTRVREPGDYVAAGATVFVLTIPKPVFVRTYVDEPDLAQIRPGAAATVTTDGNPRQSLSGKLGFISPAAEFTPKSVETPRLRTDLVYRVRIIVDDPQGVLRQGMPVTVTLQKAFAGSDQENRSPAASTTRRAQPRATQEKEAR
jgi:HlyD family secretion protein